MATSGKLEKAQLISDESDTIEFMFNPTEISFSHSIELKCEEGARTEEGMPKVSFAYPKPSQITISNIRLDTYESGTSVLTYIDQFKKALGFAEKGDAKGLRPPVYTFVWGDNSYIKCFIDALSYKLTRFLSDGTPVQATIDSLTLKEVDDSITSSGSTSYDTSSRSSR